MQLLAVSASWRLCRSGSKWNPLRGRVDTIPENDELPPVVAGAVLVNKTAQSDGEDDQEDVDDKFSSTAQSVASYSRHLDRVFVATFLGVATGLCLLPTTIAFYAVFSLVSLIVI